MPRLTMYVAVMIVTDPKAPGTGADRHVYENTFETVKVSPWHGPLVSLGVRARTRHMAAGPWLRTGGALAFDSMTDRCET
jgi:hypothetical protein